MSNLEYLETLPLPEEVKKLIAKRMDYSLQNDDYEDEEASEWLTCMFIYDLTPEGYDYWKSIEEQLKTKKAQP